MAPEAVPLLPPLEVASPVICMPGETVVLGSPPQVPVGQVPTTMPPRVVEVAQDSPLLLPPPQVGKVAITLRSDT